MTKSARLKPAFQIINIVYKYNLENHDHLHMEDMWQMEIISFYPECFHGSPHTK